MMGARIAVVAMVLGALAIGSAQGDAYLLVGGGPAPKDSQFSIEQNVLWLQPLLDARGFRHGETWFGAGNQGAADVVYQNHADPLSQYWEPLARVFGTQFSNALHYRPNQVANNAGAITPENLDAALRRQIDGLKAGDSLLFIYSGHGSFSSNRSDNALRLWGETRFSATDLAQQLAHAPEGASVRYVLPQCFSGAFMRSVFTTPDQPRTDTLLPAHCGFVSVPEHRESEGCTPAVDVGDYRDYASYFFAAIDGKTRTGDALTAQPDADGDGNVSLLEAHYYAYTEAQSTDVPRATSEYFLELSEPWHSRWLPAASLAADNPYLRLAQRLAQRLQLGDPDATAALALRRKLQAAQDQAGQALQTLKREERRARKALRRELELRWPQTQTAYGAMYQRFIENEQNEALAWIRAHPDYPQLVTLQQNIERAELALLEAQRQSAQAEKLQRALRLAHRLEQFERNASVEDKARFAALRACESWHLPPATTKP